MQMSLCIPAPSQGESGRAAALTCYAEVLRRDARHAPAWRGLGDARREAGEHAEAVACYQVGVVGWRGRGAAAAAWGQLARRRRLKQGWLPFKPLSQTMVCSCACHTS